MTSSLSWTTGFIKLPYDRDLPVKLLKTLMRARVKDNEASESE